MNKFCLIILTVSMLSTGTSCKRETTVIAEQWAETELVFTSGKQVQNPYTDIDFWVEFTGPSGERLIRPGFWDGGNTFKVRFANPIEKGEWHWQSFSIDTSNTGLHGLSGKLISAPYSGTNELVKNGLLKMSSGKRNVVHANGKPFLMIGDTPWALPWRGTIASVTEYAQKRQSQGFNVALLMSLQPDCDARGPRNRTERDAFDVAFEDLKDGHINRPNISYFQFFDTLRNILIDHGIVPVYQPVFHGYGWKGMKVLGWDLGVTEYSRYCRYLVARYGAKQAMWLVSADSDGRNKGVREGGEEIEKWDAYQQPTGLHYSPHDVKTPDWLKDFGGKYEPHMNRSFQDANWLDFQWCQTGHGGAHVFHKVALMYRNLPVKAVANGEPTYEGISKPGNGSGWWQGHEAWTQLCSGGTMGVVYGAGGLWNWKLFKEEVWPDWANSNVSWREALQLPGANYVGQLGKILKGLDFADIELQSELAESIPCIAKPGKLYIAYLSEGGDCELSGLSDQMAYRWLDPVSGRLVSEGKTVGTTQTFTSHSKQPVVLVVSK